MTSVPSRRVARSWVLLLAALLLGPLSGCQRYRWDTPNEAFVSFIRALERDERQVALGALSTGTREALAVRARQVGEASQGLVRADVESQLFGLPLPSAPLTEVRVLDTPADGASDTRATVRATWNGTTHDYLLVREAGGWKLDFSAQMKDSGADTRPSVNSPP